MIDIYEFKMLLDIKIKNDITNFIFVYSLIGNLYYLLIFSSNISSYFDRIEYYNINKYIFRLNYIYDDILFFYIFFKIMKNIYII